MGKEGILVLRQNTFLFYLLKCARSNGIMSINARK